MQIIQSTLVRDTSIQKTIGIDIDIPIGIGFGLYKLWCHILMYQYFSGKLFLLFSWVSDQLHLGRHWAKLCLWVKQTFYLFKIITSHCLFSQVGSEPSWKASSSRLLLSWCSVSQCRPHHRNHCCFLNNHYANDNQAQIIVEPPVTGVQATITQDLITKWIPKKSFFHSQREFLLSPMQRCWTGL